MKILITGGAGFIGCNLATALARAGCDVTVADNLSRPGSRRNLVRLTAEPTVRERLTFHPTDVRDLDACKDLIADRSVDAVVHLAGQTAVTSALAEPVHDFEVNVRGTLNLLEAVRRFAPHAKFLFSSTNKVYGRLDELPLDRTGTRYVLPTRPDGIDELQPIEAVGPYGCSKLAADCYVRDYATSYGLCTTVLRLSCVYGCWQNGTTDQGWVSWFAQAAMRGTEITIYGDGLQVRDLLHVDDLVEAMLGIVTDDRGVPGVFNAGGGPEFAVSIWAEFGEILRELVGRSIPVRYEAARPGDQKVYISNIGRLAEQLSWKPRRTPRDGVAEMLDWLRTQQVYERRSH